MVVSKRFGHVTCYVADVGSDLVHSDVGSEWSEKIYTLGKNGIVCSEPSAC